MDEVFVLAWSRISESTIAVKAGNVRVSPSVSDRLVLACSLTLGSLTTIRQWKVRASHQHADGNLFILVARFGGIDQRA